MHKQITHTELHDPFAHYTRGILCHDEDSYTFIAYRMPYKSLDHKVWKTEHAFKVDYNRMIARKYDV
jgi:hypothetical protein